MKSNVYGLKGDIVHRHQTTTADMFAVHLPKFTMSCFSLVSVYNKQNPANMRGICWVPVSMQRRVNHAADGVQLYLQFILLLLLLLLCLV